ncbi:MAG: flippase-like domain-containing protein [Deltaproteobacteria bacterium]|nr:flippase-like domain-containing protein [Deltaproteobacteria bacterium]MBW2445407.1 flippase-like domain-containing protein [Deltaproteobacteria bacterium]
MSSRNKKIFQFALRAVIGVGVMMLVLKSVSLGDWATLPDGSELRVTNWIEFQDDPRVEDPARGAEIRLQVEGERGEIGLDEVARNDDGTPKVAVGLSTAARSADALLILLSVLAFAPAPLLQSIRFRWMVRAQEIDLSLWEAMKLVYAGNFLNFVALGSTGGDVFKAYYVSTHTDRKTEAVTTVLLDRAVGMVSLVFFAMIVMLLRPDDPKIRPWIPIVALILAGLVAGVFVAFSRRARAILRVDDWIGRLPFGEQIKRIDAATHRMRNHPRLLLSALGLSMTLQGCAITSFMLAGMGLGMQGSIAAIPDYLVYMSIGMLVAAVPVSYQGLGTLDATLQVFFRGVYGSFSQILFLGFAIRLVQLFWALPGALVPLTGSHGPSPEKLAQLDLE